MQGTYLMKNNGCLFEVKDNPANLIINENENFQRRRIFPELR